MYVTGPSASSDIMEVLKAVAQVQAGATVRTYARSALNLMNPLNYRKSSQHSRLLLRNFNGTIAAGEMLLVVGKPGSGCTTFLKTIANMRGEYKETTGNVNYGGRSASHMAKREPAELAFCGMARPSDGVLNLISHLSRSGGG